MSATLSTGQSALFLDDTWIGQSAFVTRQWHAPIKRAGPVLVADRPWESGSIVAYGSVIFRDSAFHIWYVVWGRREPSRICYAYSEDGIRWEKPELGIHDWRGSSANNIVLISAMPGGSIDGVTVIDDPEDAAWPLKMLLYDSWPKSGSFDGGIFVPGVDSGWSGAIFIARSRDGIRWERLTEKAAIGTGDRFNALSSKQDGKFLFFGRSHVPAIPIRGRMVYRWESADLHAWKDPEPVLHSDIEDPAAMEIYSLSPFAYAGLLLGGIERMHAAPDVVDTELAWSRDGGRHWNRSRERKPFLALGKSGSFDSMWINLPASAPVCFGNRLLFHYSGRTAAHGTPHALIGGGIGLAVLRIDGFVSVTAEDREGMIETRPFTWPGGELFVNFDPRHNETDHYRSGTGELVTEVIMDNGAVAEGFSRQECNPLRINTADMEHASTCVRWQNGRSMSIFAGIPIRLRICLRNASLYSFSAREENEPIR